MTTTVKASPKRRPPRKTGNPQLDKATQAVSDRLVQNIVDEAEARAADLGQANEFQSTNGHALTKPRDMTNVRVYGPNGIEGGGHFHIHKAGCSDLRKVEYKRLASEAWGTSALTQYEIVLGIYEDIIAENPEAYGDQVSGVHELAGTVTFFPCLDGLLVTLADDERQPGKAEPKPTRRTRSPKPDPTAPSPAQDTSATGTTVPELPTTTEIVEAMARPVAAKRTAKQALARLVASAIAGSLSPLGSLEAGQHPVLAGMTYDEALRTVSQWTHHLPTGQDEEGRRWWPTGLPRPDRSDWK